MELSESESTTLLLSANDHYGVVTDIHTIRLSFNSLLHAGDDATNKRLLGRHFYSCRTSRHEGSV